MKNKIVDISLANDTEVQKNIGDIALSINFDRGEMMRVISGVKSIKIIVDEKNLDKASSTNFLQ